MDGPGEAARPASRFARKDQSDPWRRRDETLAFSDEVVWTPPLWFDQVSVVLFEPTDAVNIGGVARAMANTGFGRLRLVNPGPYTAWDVEGVAHYTGHIVRQARVASEIGPALADQQLVVGFSGKHHRDQRNQIRFRDAQARIAQAAQAGEQVALVFGREDTGLTNAALDACHLVTAIPTNPARPSLNLAQAVLLVLYGLFELGRGAEQVPRPPRHAAPPAESALLAAVAEDLERTLDAVGFLKGRARAGTMRSLRAVLYRARMDRREAALLRAALLEVRWYLHRHGLLAEVRPAVVDRPAPAEPAQPDPSPGGGR